jgi:hypothetical protein
LKDLGRFEQIVIRGLDRASQRTILWFDIPTGNGIVRKPKRTYRNPINLAQEMALTMEYEELSKADVARKLGYSRARVTQLLNLLNLPQEFMLEIMEMGDHWDRQLVTERQLRRRRPESMTDHRGGGSSHGLHAANAPS